MNSVLTNLVSVAPSKLIPGAGLFACEDDDDVFSLFIEEGTVVAGFGAVRELREGEEGTRT
jgi:hypothetical protein